MASTNRDEISRLELLHAAHPDGLVFPHLADAYRRAGRYAQAESVLKAGLRHHADYSSAHVVLGRLRLDQGKRREAENAFRRVLQLDPENDVALELLGRMAAEEGRLEEALAHLRRLASLKPSDGLSEKIAELERRHRQARQARSPAEGTAGTAAARGNGGGEPVAQEPEASPEIGLPEPGEVVTETMAELYTRQGLHDRAEVVYHKLLERDPGNARLEAKLRAAAARRRGDAPEPASPPEPEPSTAPAPPVAESSSAPEPSGAPEPSSAPEPSVPPEPGAATPPARSGPGQGSTIREYLGSVLAWTPGSEPGDSRWPVAGGGTRRDDAGEATPDDGSRPEDGSWAADDSWAADEPWADTPVTEPAGAPDGGVVGDRDESWDEPWAETPVSSRSGAPAWRPPSAPSEPDEAVADPDAAGFEPMSLRPRRSEDRPRSSPAPRPDELGLVEDELEGADPANRTLIALTDMLVGLLEYRDPFFRGSSSLTRLLATNVAEEMGLGVSDRVNLALAAVLRDLGRLALGGRLVKSPKYSQTVEGQRKIQRHVDLALNLLEGIELPPAVTLAVRHHHERWDGAGYPEGLAREEIPKLARLLAAVDSFAAMVSPRTYRLPRKVPEAAQEMKKAAGSQYDPEVVDALLRVLERRDQPHLGFVRRHHVLMVSPDQPGALVTAAKLCTSGYLAEVAITPDSARERMRRVPVAALVVSAQTGAEDAEALIRDLRLDPLFSALPIVVVEAETVALRVRLLESGADVCFPPGISYGELQGTLGALVRRTLHSRESRPTGGGDDEAPWMALQGDVQDFPLAWLLQVMKYDSRTAGIGIRTATSQGAIYIESGDAVHAQIRGGEQGESALKRMLAWRKGRFTVQPGARPKERSIDSSIMHLLLTQAVEEDHAAAGVFGAVSDQG